MADDTLPPVGATVVDSEGRLFELVDTWWQHRPFGGAVEYRSIRGDLTLVWRLQQERDGLKARVVELEAKLDPILAAATQRREAYLLCVPAISGTPVDVPLDWRGRTPLELATEKLIDLCSALAALAPKEASDGK